MRSAKDAGRPFFRPAFSLRRNSGFIAVMVPDRWHCTRPTGAFSNKGRQPVLVSSGFVYPGFGSSGFGSGTQRNSVTALISLLWTGRFPEGIRNQVDGDLGFP